MFIERKLSKRDAHVASVAEENGDGPIGRLMRNTLANIAEYERDVIRERLNAGKARGMQTGRHVHGQIPFGYRTVGRGELETDLAAAAIVKRIYQASKAGDGPGRIAKDPNAEGVPSARGGRWSRQAVAAILRNPTYKGERYNVRKAHDAIVSTQLWNAANR